MPTGLSTYTICTPLGRIAPLVIPPPLPTLTGSSFRVSFDPDPDGADTTLPVPDAVLTAPDDFAVSYTHLTLPTNREV